MEFQFQIIRSDRKSVAIQITPTGEILVRCPRRMPEAQLRQFVESKRSWIESHMAQIPPRQEPFTAAQLREMADRAMTVIPERVAHFAPLVGVTYGRITIRSQRTRWGSCSSAGNLNFNCLLMQTPPEVVDYVVVHELCHRKELNHSPRFWAEVERVLPDYRECRKWLKDNGNALIGRLPD